MVPVTQMDAQVRLAVAVAVATSGNQRQHSELVQPTPSDKQTQADIKQLTDPQSLPCAFEVVFPHSPRPNRCPTQRLFHLQDGTLKCEACLDGCQEWSSVNKHLHLGNERTHYVVPGTNNTSKQVDVLLYRCV